jgi:5-methylcytosine-specific restriction endonuclease McrA
MSKRDYHDPFYAEWRRKVRQRDNGQCQWPGCKERKYQKLAIHHIRPWATHVELRYNIDNGITLCNLHHKTTMGNEMHFLNLFIELIRQINERTKGN